MLVSSLSMALMLAHLSPAEVRNMTTQSLPATDGDGVIAYDERGGDGPLVVAVPGLGDLRSEYRFLAADLVARGFHVVTMDLRGHGDASTTFHDVSVAAVADDVIALIRHLDRGPAVVVGCSFGAAAVADAAARAPHLVRGVIVLGPSMREQPPGAVMRAAMSVLFDAPWRVSAWLWYMNGLFVSARPSDHDAHMARVRAMLQEPKRFDLMRRMLVADRKATEPRLALVRAPVLVVMGSKDGDFKDPTAEAHILAERTRGEAFVVDGVGHYPHVEAPTLVLPRIAAFLAALPAAQPHAAK